MLTAESLADLENREKIVGTAAELTQEDHTWFIIVPNGFYDVKVYIKLVPTASNINTFTGEIKNTIGLLINENSHKQDDMTIDDEIVIDNPNLGVTNREIRIRWVKGTINISELEIIPQNPPLKKGGPKIDLGNNNYAGAPCFEFSINCVFSDRELKDVMSCPKWVKIGGKATNKNIACMNKCIESSYDDQTTCNLYCPETLSCKKEGTTYKCDTPKP